MKIDKNQYKATNEEYLAAKRKEAGVRALSKGVLVEIITEGHGKSAKDAAVVSVFYSGSLINGKQFDSNADQGYPDAFRLRELIEGWQIAIPEMHEGDKWRIYVPSEVGYGKRGEPGIPGNSTLIFEIELVSIN